MLSFPVGAELLLLIGHLLPLLGHEAPRHLCLDALILNWAGTRQIPVGLKVSCCYKNEGEGIGAYMADLAVVLGSVGSRDLDEVSRTATPPTPHGVVGRGVFGTIRATTEKGKETKRKGRLAGRRNGSTA